MNSSINEIIGHLNQIVLTLKSSKMKDQLINRFIGYRGEELSFKLDIDPNFSSVKFKLEEPDQNYCMIEFSKENDQIYSLITSSKLDNRSKNAIKFCFEIKLDQISITYWPTLIGNHTLNVISNDNSTSTNKILIKDQLNESSSKQSSLFYKSSDHSSNSTFIKINLSKSDESSTDNMFLDNFNSTKSDSFKSFELNNLKRLGKVRNELNKITTKYKISNRTISTTSSLSTRSNLSTNTSSLSSNLKTPKKSFLNAMKPINDFEPKSFNSTIDPTALGESNETFSQMNADCTSHSFVAKFSPILPLNSVNIDLNQNSSLNQSEQKIILNNLKFVKNDQQSSINDLKELDYVQQDSMKDLNSVSDKKESISYSNKSIQQDLINDQYDSVNDQIDKVQSDSVQSNLIFSYLQDKTYDRSIDKSVQLVEATNQQVNSADQLVDQPVKRANQIEDFSESIESESAAKQQQFKSSETSLKNFKLNCDQIIGSANLIDKNLAKSECDLAIEFSKMLSDKNSLVSQSNSELTSYFNSDFSYDQIMFRKKKESRYEKSSTRLNVHSSQMTNKALNSNLNSKLDKKLYKKKRSSLEPLIDKTIDPSRKSIENLFYKLYLNQVHGEELTDTEISDVINKPSSNKRFSTNKLNGQANDSSSKNSCDSKSIKSSVKQEIKLNDKSRPKSAVNDVKVLQKQNLTKNLSKISCNNLNNDVMINSNGENLDQEDEVDGCKNKIESRRMIFGQFDSNQLNVNQGKQFSEQFQKNRSKKKIGKRKITPLYSNYNKNSSQVDEIFIILKENDKELSNLDHEDTNLIYDSFIESSRKSTDSDLTKGLTYNLKNESLIYISDEKTNELSCNSSNNESLNHKLNVNESNQELKKSNDKLIDESIESNDQISLNSTKIEAIDNHGILPVHQMVKHWTQTSNTSKFDETKLTESRSRATVEISNLSNMIKNKKAIFENASSFENKENKPKNMISNTLSFRRKQFAAWLDNPTEQSKDSSDNQLIKTKLKESNQQMNKVDKFKYFSLWNENKNENGSISELNKKNKFKDFNEPINDIQIKSDKNSILNKQIINDQMNGQTNGPIKELNEPFKVNVKQKKNFWESLIVKKKNVK